MLLTGEEEKRPGRERDWPMAEHGGSPLNTRRYALLVLPSAVTFAAAVLAWGAGPAIQVISAASEGVRDRLCFSTLLNSTCRSPDGRGPGRSCGYRERTSQDPEGRADRAEEARRVLEA